MLTLTYYTISHCFILPLSAHKQNKEIPSMAVLALFIETIDGIAYFAIAIFIFLHLSDIICLTEGLLKL